MTELTEKEIRILQRDLVKAQSEAKEADERANTAQQRLSTQEGEITDLRSQVQTLTLQTGENTAHSSASLIQPAEHMSKDGLSSPKKLKPFSGGYSPTFSEWLKRFEEICRASQWKDNRRAEILPIYLESIALDAYHLLSEDVQSDYETLKTELSKILQPVESPRFCAGLLYARKQGKTELVSAYGADIVSLVRGAFPLTDTFPLTAQQQVMRESFISGLRGTDKQGIRFQVLSKEPKTFEEALAQAQKAEAQEWLLHGTNPIASNQPTTTGHEILLVGNSRNNSSHNYQFQGSQANPPRFQQSWAPRGQLQGLQRFQQNWAPRGQPQRLQSQWQRGMWRGSRPPTGRRFPQVARMPQPTQYQQT